MLDIIVDYGYVIIVTIDTMIAHLAALLALRYIDALSKYIRLLFKYTTVFPLFTHEVTLVLNRELFI